MIVGADLDIVNNACQAKSLSEYIIKFSRLFQKKYALQSVSYFSLNDVKDQLQLASSSCDELSMTSSILMPISNTQNPVVYSLITNKPYFVQSLAKLLDAGDAFKQMAQSLPADMAMECFPIELKDSGMQGVFVFIAEEQVLKQMQICQLQNSLLTVFSSIYRLFKVVEQNNQEKNQLKIDLFHKSEDDYKKTILQQIARRFIGRSPVIQEVWGLLAKAAVSEMAIMLRGETGAGKDLAASVIHDYSRRADEAFIVVNCAAIPENLLESELFGHCKGAFTGANTEKKGMIALADKGTLFLDEIGDLSLVLQAKLLRVLQEKKFIPVGGKKEVYSDFRLITATHRPLELWVKEEKFRQDLFYRLNQFGITLPTLSDRKEDIPKIVNLFINDYMKENNVHIAGCSDSALKELKKYTFPGNVRELKNIVYQACLFVDNKNAIIERQNIVERLANIIPFTSTTVSDQHELIDINNISLSEACEAYEFKVIRTALIEAGGSRSKAAIKLSIPKRTLAYKCKKWDIHADGI